MCPCCPTSLAVPFDVRPSPELGVGNNNYVIIFSSELPSNHGTQPVHDILKKYDIIVSRVVENIVASTLVV